MKKLIALTLTVALAMVVTASNAFAQAKVGAPAPAFSLQDQSGNTVTLEQFKGKVVVLEWFNNECPYVVKHYKNGDMNRVASQWTDKGVVWLAVNSTNGKTNADNAAVAKDWNINRPILNDATGATGRAYGAKTTPHMYVIDTAGNVAYIGAIDSNSSSKPEDVSGATNYVSKALDEVLAGKTVTTAETKSYGCSVKYAKK
jgi:peroxiredoxin